MSKNLTSFLQVLLPYNSPIRFLQDFYACVNIPMKNQQTTMFLQRRS